jgi:anti-sigma factor RsiW
VQCDELRTLLHGYVDGELDLVRNLEIEHHLEECSACAEACQDVRALRQALADPILYHQPPGGLRDRLRSTLRQAHAPRVAFPMPSRRLLAVAASLAFVAVLAWGFVSWRSVRTEELLALEVVSNHVRSLMAGHLLDVVSTDQHTVKPWLNDRLDFSADVKNPAPDDYPLIGGRLDYLDKRNVAAVVYKRHKHTINVFIWPTNAPDSAPRDLTRQGYHLACWTTAGMSWWVISDLNEQDLNDFIGLLRGR